MRNGPLVDAAAALLGPVRTGFAALVDYAGLFPPARLGLEAALDEYAVARRSRHAWMLGRFIVPASRLDELAELAGASEFPISAILDVTSEPRGWFDEAAGAIAKVAAFRSRRPALPIESLEVPLPRLERLRDSYDAPIGQLAAMRAGAGMAAIETFAELPFDDRWRGEISAALRAMARSKISAKMRFGGQLAAAFPAPQDAAAFITAARDERVAYKATAGLHHPVRHYDVPTGFLMHGFLNVLLASAAAAVGVDEATIERILADEIATDFVVREDAFVWRDLALPEPAIEATRRRGLRAYGSCSFAEPVDGLQAMKLL